MLTVCRSNFLLFDRQNVFGMVYDETNASNHAQQLDEQNMTIYRPALPICVFCHAY